MNTETTRVLSAMRPNGRLHLGHYLGVLQNWQQIQYQYKCFFMLADIHGIINNYQASQQLSETMNEMVIDWLAAGVDPSQATIFIQSRVPEHFELASLLGVITPLGWLERVPSYKDALDELEHTDGNTYGLLGSPLLQSADILLYNSHYVITGEEQAANIELTREIARRFNHLFGREDGFEEKASASIKKLGIKKAALYAKLLIKYQQEGNDDALDTARYLLQDALNLSHGDRERLFAFLENKGKVFLQEPHILTGSSTRIVGTDGTQMSIIRNNTINIREKPEMVSSKIRGMITDPARIKRSDRGTPSSCPVWSLHQIYSTQEVSDWVEMGCLSAGIGCLDCKQPLIDAINLQQHELIEKAKPYQEDSTLVKRILSDGCGRAREIASTNLKSIKHAMNIDY